MTDYIVYRHGYDDRNQSAARGLPETMAVVRMEADSAEEACRIAGAWVALAPNQYLSAEPAAEADAREAALNRTARTHQ